MCVPKSIMCWLCYHMGKDWTTLKQVTRFFFFNSCDVTQYIFSHERVVDVLQTGSVFCGDGICGWCCVISGHSPVSVVTCWRNNCRACFCESQNLQFFSRNFPGSNFITDTGCPHRGYVNSTVLRGKQWGTDKWAWPFMNACFLMHHSPSSYLSMLWDRPCVIQSAVD
jgi:hypothetical protein